MTVIEGVLIAAIVILVLLVIRNLFASRRKHVPLLPSAGCAREQQALAAPKPDLEKKQPVQLSREKEIDDKLRENQEWFATCGGNAEENKQMLDCVCGDEPSMSFAKFDYGAADMDYKDYVASQAVDDKVIKNHAQFVRDRKGLGPEGEFITGRTYSPDSHDSYDPIPWIGIRGRPQYVPQCNPTQVPDVDTNLYKGNRKYCFWT